MPPGERPYRPETGLAGRAGLADLAPGRGPRSHDGDHAVHRPGPVHWLPGVRGRLPRVRLAPRQVHDPPGLHRRRADRGGHADGLHALRGPGGPCAEVCPADAILVTADGVVQEAAKERCIGCGNCVDACPFGVPKLDVAEMLQYKCNLCYDRTSVGLAPMCATVCPTGAIFYGSVEELEADRPAPRRSTCSASGRPRSARLRRGRPGGVRRAGPGGPVMGGPPGRRVPAGADPGRHARSPAATTCASWSRCRPGWPRARPGWPSGCSGATAAARPPRPRSRTGSSPARRSPSATPGTTGAGHPPPRRPAGRLVGRLHPPGLRRALARGGRPPGVPLPRRRVSTRPPARSSPAPAPPLPAVRLREDAGGSGPWGPTGDFADGCCCQLHAAEAAARRASPARRMLRAACSSALTVCPQPRQENTACAARFSLAVCP